MLQLYDDKLFDYFKETFKADVAVVPVSEYWSVVSMHEEGQLQLPAIVLGRTTWTNAKDLESWVIAKKGRNDRIRNNKAIQEQAIPVQLDYTITLLATTQDDIDELTSEVLFCILNYPRLTIDLPYGSDRQIHGQIMQNGDLQDSTARDKFSDTGILYQQIIPIRVLGSNIINIREQNLRFFTMDVDTINDNRK